MAYYIQEQGSMSQRRGSGFYFYHYDGLGSTKALTDVNQNVQASYIYDAWGNILQSSGTVTNPYLYVGELGYYADGDSGMYLLTQRWYNPVVGRFVARDPLRKKFNRYMYGHNNPAILTDPSGLLTFGGLWQKIREILEFCTHLCKAIEETGIGPEGFKGCMGICLPAYAAGQAIYDIGDWLISRPIKLPPADPCAGLPKCTPQQKKVSEDACKRYGYCKGEPGWKECMDRECCIGKAVPPYDQERCNWR